MKKEKKGKKGRGSMKVTEVSELSTLRNITHEILRELNEGTISRGEYNTRPGTRVRGLHQALREERRLNRRLERAITLLAARHYKYRAYLSRDTGVDEFEERCAGCGIEATWPCKVLDAVDRILKDRAA